MFKASVIGVQTGDFEEENRMMVQAEPPSLSLSKQLLDLVEFSLNVFIIIFMSE